MTVFATICLITGLCALLIQRTRTLLTYFQQDEYDGLRFLHAWKQVRLFDIFGTAATVAAVSFHLLTSLETLSTILLGLVFFVLSYREGLHKFKKPLSMTERASRIYRITLLIVFVLAGFCIVHPLFAVMPLQLAPVIMIAANLILQPLQRRINTTFQNQAKTKLLRLDPVRIGITGSFGKTTVKHMLAEILEASGPVYFSKGSINTVLGHTRHIRQRLQWSHQYFVAEMGAYGIGSIQRLCSFIEPKFGIVTAVGDAHTERFGSIEAIALAKSELASDVCARHGTIVINSDLLQYKPFSNLRESFERQVITVGFDDADVKVEYQELEDGSWYIELYSHISYLDGVKYELPLLGDHNILNSALAVVLALKVDPDIVDKIPYFTQTISQVPHRLQKIGNPGTALILDDAYNSNELGFLSAVSSMDKLARQRGGRRILVTPGIAELGLEHDRVHKRLGSFCAQNCDLIYVVNPARIQSFLEAADSSTATVVKVSTFAEARSAISEILQDEDVVLYENDLPDILEERRLL